MIRKDKHPTASLLFGVTVIQFLVALLHWGVQGPAFNWVDWAYSLNFLVFAALAVWARHSPVVPAAIGFLLYAAYLRAQAYLGLHLLLGSLMLKLPVAILLTIALWCAIFRPGGGTPSASEQP